MSFAASKWVRTVQVPDVIAGAVLLFLVNSHNDQTDLCCPSKKTIAAFLHCHLGTVERALNRLKSAGLISWQLVPSKTGCHNQYTLVGLSQGVTLSQEVTPSQRVTLSQRVTPLQQVGTQGSPTQNGLGVTHSERVLNTNSKEKEIYKEKEEGRSDESEAPLLTPTESVSSSPVKKANGKKTKRTPLVFFVNEIKELSQDWRDYCIERRPDLDPDTTFEKFIDYYDVKRERKKFENWTLTWYRWVRNEHVTLGTIYANEKKQVVNGNGHSRIKCPFNKIIGIYRLELPSLPQMEMVTEKIQKDTESFWNTMVDFGKATTEEEGLVTVQQYFNSVSRTDFLMGKGNRGQTWTANFGWLVDPKNTANIINGIYEGKKQ